MRVVVNIGGGFVIPRKMLSKPLVNNRNNQDKGEGEILELAGKWANHNNHLKHLRVGYQSTFFKVGSELIWTISVGVSITTIKLLMSYLRILIWNDLQQCRLITRTFQLGRSCGQGRGMEPERVEHKRMEMIINSIIC